VLGAAGALACVIVWVEHFRRLDIHRAACAAVIREDWALVVDLLDGGLDIDAGLRVPANRDGDTLLMMAASRNDGAAVRLLLERGAGVDRRSRSGATALMRAAERGALEVARILLDHGADPALMGGPGGDTPLILAARRGETAMVVLLVEHGADVDQRNALGVTPLIAAAGAGPSPTTLQALIDGGADVNAITPQGESALIHAVERAGGLSEQLDKMRRLLEGGAAPNLADRLGRTVLHAAAHTGSAQMVELLLDGGADPAARGLHFGGSTALEIALRRRDPEAQKIVELLGGEASTVKGDS
jgi:ankyrin repeat protein